MEVSKLVLSQSCCFSGAGMDVHARRSHYSAPSTSLSISGHGKSGYSLTPEKICGFSDPGHLEYYNYRNNSSGIIGCGKKENIKEKETKKIKNKLKFLKGLLKDLSTFSNMGFGFNSDEVKGNTITDAAKLLIEQLERLRTEEKEFKKKMKEEKTKLKAAWMQNLECEMSSSSSSESNSECREVVDMNRLKRPQAILDTLPRVDEEVASPSPSLSTQEGTTTEVQTSILESVPAFLSTITEEKIDVGRGVQECSSRTDSLCRDANNASSSHGNTMVKKASAKKIEVCMGGKCKKSGAAALLEEFQSTVGIAVGVSGCKCMGKCRSGPNVRVQNNLEGVQAGGVDVSVRSPSNPLFIGVGLEDVDLIVANLLGENQPKKFGAAAASS